MPSNYSSNSRGGGGTGTSKKPDGKITDKVRYHNMMCCGCTVLCCESLPGARVTDRQREREAVDGNAAARGHGVCLFHQGGAGAGRRRPSYLDNLVCVGRGVGNEFKCLLPEKDMGEIFVLASAPGGRYV